MKINIYICSNNFIPSTVAILAQDAFSLRFCDAMSTTSHAAIVFSASDSATASAKTEADVKTVTDAIELVNKTTEAVGKAQAYALEVAATAEGDVTQASLQLQKLDSYIRSGDVEGINYVRRASSSATEATNNVLNAARAYIEAYDDDIDAKLCLARAVAHAQMTGYAAAVYARSANNTIKQVIRAAVQAQMTEPAAVHSATHADRQDVD